MRFAPRCTRWPLKLTVSLYSLLQICVQRLEEKFPNSPRVDALYGLLQELESPEKAREFYEGKLQEDENNIVRRSLVS